MHLPIHSILRSNFSVAPQNNESSLRKHKKLDAFPIILYRILSDPRLHDIITWVSHGCAWKVLNRGRFMNEVVPEFFNLNYFKSFLRQVNGWGFIRINKGIDKGSYFHKVRYFLSSQTIQRGTSNCLDFLDYRCPI